MQKNKELKGLRGWLILIGIGLLLSISRQAHQLIAVYYPLFTNGTFTTATTPGTSLYSPLWGVVLISEALIISILTATYVYLSYLFISKHYLFPRIYIATLLASAIFVPLDAWVCSFVLVDVPMFDFSTLKEMTRALISTFIWVPYMLVSKRVKATFVEHRPHGDDTRTAASV